MSRIKRTPSKDSKGHSSIYARSQATVSFGPTRQPTFKQGDEERIKLMKMVKEGKMSIDGALHTAHGLGLGSTPYEDVDEFEAAPNRRQSSEEVLRPILLRTSMRKDNS